jgi:NADP-dependent 3-hydroxy acid dehydrogenase YdfG
MIEGPAAPLGSAVHNLTKWGVVGFSEGLRQEALHANIRVTVIEPGYVETELQGHNEGDPIVTEAMEKTTYALTRPQHVAINEVLVRPTKQSR